MLDRNSVTWRYAGDARGLLFLGRAFLLQAAHPTIGAGVLDHSNFKEDPFGRFEQTFGLVLKALYAADGPEVAQAVREAHKPIKGVAPDGRRYHAYEPEAYFWVLATGHETVVVSSRRFGRPMTPAQERLAYDEMRELGRRFGLRDRDMPPTLGEFHDWYEWVLDERIENNQTVRDVLATVRRPNPPRQIPRALWPLPREIVARLGWLATVGTLPRHVQERLNIRWSRADEAQLSIIAGVFKALARTPDSWWYLPPAREAYARTRASRRPAATPAAPGTGGQRLAA